MVFETKCYTTVCRHYAREFNVHYVEAPQQKFILYTDGPKAHD